MLQPRRLSSCITTCHRRMRYQQCIRLSSVSDTFRGRKNSDHQPVIEVRNKLLQLQLKMENPSRKSEFTELMKITQQPHSLHLRWLPAKVCLYSHHQYHQVVVICLSEACSVEIIDKPFDWPSTGTMHKLEKGGALSLMDHQPHYLHGPEDGASARLLCVVSPPLVDSVEQDENGSFQLTPSDDWFP